MQSKQNINKEFVTPIFSAKNPLKNVAKLVEKLAIDYIALYSTSVNLKFDLKSSLIEPVP